ncbi:hypothetical protein LSAT2_019991 [Lamellibrachia satsuma]|nr:hypothetical protein LSAT2_019991 [Lamellibrachia satsuma]
MNYCLEVENYMNYCLEVENYMNYCLEVENYMNYCLDVENYMNYCLEVENYMNYCLERKSSLLSAVVNDWLWTSLGMLDDLCDAESCHTTRLSRDDGLLMFRSYNAGHLKRTAVGRTSGAKAHASDGAKAHANDGAKAHASDAADANVTDDANHTNAVEANKYDDDTKYVDTNGVDNARDLVEMPNCSFEQIQRCD